MGDLFGNPEDEVKRHASDMSIEAGTQLERAVKQAMRGMGGGLYDTAAGIARGKIPDQLSKGCSEL